MSKLIYEPPDWETELPVQYVRAMQTYHGRIPQLFDDFKRKGRHRKEKITTYDILREIELTMPRKGRNNGTAKGDGGYGSGGASSRNEWKWVNIKLTDEDASILDKSDATIEYLATCICVLADDGIGVTIKPVDQGKSFCVTLYRPDYPSNGVTLGVSSFGGSVRDALLVSLYKLEHYGGDDFSGFTVEDNLETARPRFR